MKKESIDNFIMAFIFIIICLIAMIRILNDTSVKSQKKENNQLTETTKIKKTEKYDNTNSYYNEYKTYKISSDEYKKYITSTIKSTIISNETYSLNRILYNYPYIKVYIYYNTPVTKEYFDNKNKEIANNIFNILKKNNYKEGHFYEYQYNIISLEFYSKETDCNVNCNQNDFIQIDVLEIKNHYSLDNYLNNE